VLKKEVRIPHDSVIWEVVPFLCPHYGGLMTLVSVIYERKLINKILDHLGLLKESKPKRSGSPVP